MQKSLVDLPQDIYDEIKSMSAVFLTPKEIAIILEFDVVQFTNACNAEGSMIYQAFQSGRMKSEYELRQSILKLAKSGSSPAQTMALELLNDSKQKMID